MKSVIRTVTLSVTKIAGVTEIVKVKLNETAKAPAGSSEVCDTHRVHQQSQPLDLFSSSSQEDLYSAADLSLFVSLPCLPDPAWIYLAAPSWIFLAAQGKVNGSESDVYFSCTWISQNNIVC